MIDDNIKQRKVGERGLSGDVVQCGGRWNLKGEGGGDWGIKKKLSLPRVEASTD